MTDVLHMLEATIHERRKGDPRHSYVARLTHEGRGKMAQKLGEEAVEAVIAATTDDRSGMIGESADLLFHLLATLADMGIGWNEVLDELSAREGTSGLDEKASRTN